MLYFAYGSNMNPQQMQSRIGNNGKCTLLGSAILSDYELVFDVPDSHAKGAGYANIRPKTGSIVYGVLYDLDEYSFSILDKYEHVPILYGRESIYILFKNEIQEASVYVGKSISKHKLHPTSRYLGRILLGKDYLPKEYYKLLSNVQTCPDPKFDSIKVNKVRNQKEIIKSKKSV